VHNFYETCTSIKHCKELLCHVYSKSLIVLKHCNELLNGVYLYNPIYICIYIVIYLLFLCQTWFRLVCYLGLRRPPGSPIHPPRPERFRNSGVKRKRIHSKTFEFIARRGKCAWYFFVWTTQFDKCGTPMRNNTVSSSTLFVQATVPLKFLKPVQLFPTCVLCVRVCTLFV